MFFPRGGFEWCDPSNPPTGFSCDQPKYKWRADPFDPLVDSFTDLTGYTDANDPALTYDPVSDRWELFWDQGWNIQQAGLAQDNLIFRFQAHITLDTSGSYFNEIFADVNCSAPSVLISEGVTSQAEYCASYSWPAGGVMVPTYDVQATTGSITAQGNIIVDWSGAFPTGGINSWHVN